MNRTTASAPPPSWSATARMALAGDLRAEIKGQVLFDHGSRALYATDASNYRQVPIGVVLPRDAHDVAATLAVCRVHAAPVLPRGGGTALAGQCCNAAVVMDFSRYMNRIVEFDGSTKTARVQPGVTVEQLCAEASKHKLSFLPAPSFPAHHTVGGVIGNNSCGIRSAGAGRISDHVLAMDVLTYDGLRLQVGTTTKAQLAGFSAAGGRRGDIYARLAALRDQYGETIRRRFPDLPRRMGGYNLSDLLPEQGFHVARALAGSEGTCITMLEATVQLVESAPGRALLALGFPDIYRAAERVMEVIAFGPTGLAGADDRVMAARQSGDSERANTLTLPEGRGWLLVEFGGTDAAEAEQRARRALAALQRSREPPSAQLYVEPSEQVNLWTHYENGLGAIARGWGSKLAWPGWENSAVSPERLGEYLRALRRLLDRQGYHAALYGHFASGCVHARIDFDLETAAGMARYRGFLQQAADLAMRFGGSFAGHGQARSELLEKAYGAQLTQAFREFKAAWDPEGKMNPGNMVEPGRSDEHLRLGSRYDPQAITTIFRYPRDQGDFARATLRCVGAAKCRRERGGTMCPSYQVTRDEKHTTRGRAHLLFEMLQGEVLEALWRDGAVKESLDLCLSCKGCRGECPVNVDMATYKAEFLYHYHRHHRRPRQARLFGNVDRLARWAARAPTLSNALLQRPLVATLAKRAANIAPERRLPALALEHFTAWFARREARADGAPVILWPDTFSNYFRPERAKAAVHALEDAGYSPRLPGTNVCCGRPLYEYGLLDRARALLRKTLDALAGPIRDGVPIVVLEPACASVFRVELPELFSHDRQALRLSRQTYLLAEFLGERAASWKPPRVEGSALVHMHCHHKAVMNTTPDLALMDALGLDYRVLDSGCCGMAGGFGYEREKYDLSIACGEKVLLPEVRAAATDTLIISDGFSCYDQILQCTGRHALHLAEVVSLALTQRYASL